MTDGIHTGDECEARGGADGLGETLFEQDSLTREVVDGWRSGEFVAITAQEGVIIFADEPKDVWAVRLGRAGREEVGVL